MHKRSVLVKDFRIDVRTVIQGCLSIDLWFLSIFMCLIFDWNWPQMTHSPLFSFRFQKGQYTDEFLTSFRTSCFLPPQNSTSQKLSSCGMSQSNVSGQQKTPSILDHRLRSNIYWNNAGISNFQKRRKCSDVRFKFKQNFLLMLISSTFFTESLLFFYFSIVLWRDHM